MEAKTESKPIPWERSFRYDAAVIGLIVVLLIAALGLKAWAMARASVVTRLDPSLSVRVPASWAARTEKGTLLSIRDLQSKGSFKVTFSVTATALDPAALQPIRQLAEVYAEARGEDLISFRLLDLNDTELDGLEAVKITYAYVESPPGSSLGAGLPVVVQGVDSLVIHANMLYVFTFAAPATSFSEQTATLDAILESVSFEREE